MKLAHVLRRISFADWGGTEQVVWNLARAQMRAGHDVRLFATEALYRGGGPDAAPSPGNPPVLRFPCVYPWFPMTRRVRSTLDRKGGNPLAPALFRELRRWGPDVVHCHAMGRLAEGCVRLCERTGARSAVSLHGGGANIPAAEAASLREPTRGLFPWGKALEKALRLNRRVPEDFGGVVCVGEDEYEHWRAVHPRVLFLPNGVDVSVFAGDRAGAGSAAGPRIVLCVARIDRQKDQMALVEALPALPGDVRVRLVGPVTQPDYRDALLSRAAALGVAGRLEIVGAVPPSSPELVAEYRRADVFALPSRHEPFGIAVLEAWAAGVPVVASGAGGLGRLCAANPGAAATFPPGDGAALAAALSRVLSPDFDRASAVAVGRAAAARYDWSALAARLLDFYAAL